MQKNKRIYVCYWEWEDWINGMWRSLPTKEEERFLLKRAIAFTSNHKLYGSWMRKVVIAWPRTMLHNLTNPSINQKAFIGHCAVTMALNIPEFVTREAWQYLSEEQQRLANIEAETTYQLWRKELKRT